MVVQKYIPYKETELNPCYKKLYSLNDQEKEMWDLEVKAKGEDVYKDLYKICSVFYCCLVQYLFVDDKDGGVIWQE